MAYSCADLILIFFVILTAVANVFPGKPKHFRHGVAWDFERNYSASNRVAYYDSHDMAKRGSNPAAR